VLTPTPLYTIYLPILMKDGASTSTVTPAMHSAPATWPSLRVPVYAAVRPASNMHVAQTALDFTAITTTTLSLIGQGLNTGSSYPTDTLSLVAAFELAEAWPNVPGLLDQAELKYLGASNNFGSTGSITATTLFFAITAQGDWSAPLAPEAQFKVFIDIDRNGSDDFVLSNDTLSGQSNDVFYSCLTRLSDNAVSYPLPLNLFPASTYDVRPFNTNVMILAVPASAIGLTAANPAFRYRVESYAANSLISASAVHTYTASRAGLDFSGGLAGMPLWPDLPTTAIPVSFNTGAYEANGSIGALLLHLHNLELQRAGILAVVAP
jgi:hypothetical protein